MKNIDKKCISSRKNIYEKSIFSDTDMIFLTEDNGYQYLLDINAEGRVSTDFEWKSSVGRRNLQIFGRSAAYALAILHICIFLSESHFAYPSKIYINNLYFSRIIVGKNIDYLYIFFREDIDYLSIFFQGDIDYLYIFFINIDRSGA